MSRHVLLYSRKIWGRKRPTYLINTNKVVKLNANLFVASIISSNYFWRSSVLDIDRFWGSPPFSEGIVFIVSVNDVEIVKSKRKKLLLFSKCYLFVANLSRNIRLPHTSSQNGSNNNVNPLNISPGRPGEARDSRWRAALNVGIRRRYLSLHLFTEYNSNKFNKGEGNVWQMHESPWKKYL